MRTLVLMLLVLLESMAWQPARADDFCVENKVYDSDQLLSSSLTVFRSGVVYDLLDAPTKETFIFDPARGRLVLLDHKAKRKVELTTGQVEDFCEQLRQQAVRANSAVLRFLVKPEFAERTDEATKDLVLESRWMNYRLKTVDAPTAQVARQYADYVRWQAQTNMMIAPGSTPAFPRLAVQEVIVGRNQLATHVERTTFGTIPGHAVYTVRAEHRHQWRLLDSDLKQIDRVNADLAEYTSISLDEYQKALQSDVATTGGK